MPYEPAPGVTLWRRDELSLPAPKVPVPQAQQAKSEFIVHHSGGQELGRVKFAEWWRQIFDYHTNQNKWIAEGYNFGVANDPHDPQKAHILEGRGWRGVGAHTGGHNTVGLGVCYLRNGPPTPGAKRAIRFLYDDAGKQLGRPLKTMVHSDAAKTACPGDLRDWVKGPFNVDPYPTNNPGPPTGLNAPIIASAATPSGLGYWLVASDGGVFTFGDAEFFGSMGGQHLQAPVVDVCATPTGKGYWLVAQDGGIFNFGDAPFLGSMGGKGLNKPVSSIHVSPSGDGYRLVAQDGGIFNFGDAPFLGTPVK